MDLTTTYLGLTLPNPFISSAGPLVDDLDMVRRLEDAGVAAIVMHSLFEEQIEEEALRTLQDMELHSECVSETKSFFPSSYEFKLGPENYLDQIRRIKSATSVPVIASLNGTTASGWLRYAELIEEAGADALELNIYYLPSDRKESGAAVEKRVLDSVQTVRSTVSIPIAVKLSPFYSSLIHLAVSIEALGANGLVLFNRVYEPEIDAELMDVIPRVHLSTSAELPLRLRWLGILRGHLRCSLAATGGIHSGLDAVKAIMSGANAVQMLSALLLRGPEYLKVARTDMEHWMADHYYTSVREMTGCLSLQHCPDPAAYERGNYARILQSWR